MARAFPLDWLTGRGPCGGSAATRHYFLFCDSLYFLIHLLYRRPQSEVESTLQRINLHKARSPLLCPAVPLRQGGCKSTREVDCFAHSQGVHATIVVNNEGQPVRTNAEVQLVPRSRVPPPPQFFPPR